MCKVLDTAHSICWPIDPMVVWKLQCPNKAASPLLWIQQHLVDGLCCTGTVIGWLRWMRWRSRFKITAKYEKHSCDHSLTRGWPGGWPLTNDQRFDQRAAVVITIDQMLKCGSEPRACENNGSEGEITNSHPIIARLATQEKLWGSTSQVTRITCMLHLPKVV